MKPIGPQALVLVATAVAACGSSTSGSGDATRIDVAGVETGIRGIAPVIRVCSPGGSLRADALPDHDRLSWLGRLLDLRRERNAFAALQVQPLGPVRPADQFGDCGGRMTYPEYSHAAGVTTGTLAFENYCTTDTETGEREILDGSISFVNRGTPSPSGPITNSVEAESRNGVTATTRSATGAVLSRQNVRFSGYRYDVGVPGGAPTPANPNRVAIRESHVADLLTGKTYRQTGLAATLFSTASGGEQMTLAGRAYRSNGEYFDIRTTAPLVTDASGDWVGGQLTFTGAGSTNAVMTLVPGPTLQATMTVNGTPLTGRPACR